MTNDNTVANQAKGIVDAAGEAGGIDEVRRLAAFGWPLSRDLDGDSPALRAAIQSYAAELVFE